MGLGAYLHAHPGAWIAAFSVLGLIAGSFLNVVIHRLPRMLEREWRSQCAELAGEPPPAEAQAPYDLVRPRSHCPACGAPIGALRNIPVLSWIALGGRCGDCGVRIPLRYPLVEMAAALLAAAVAWRFGVGWQAALAAVLSWALLALAVIDLDTQLLPDAITLPLLWLGLLANTGGLFVPLADAVLGAAAGYLVLWAVYHAFRLLTGKEGMGYGDFKLLAMLGAWLGWQSLPAVILLSSFVGAVIGIGLIVFGGRARGMPIPFGPYLAGAGWLTLMWGDALLAGYLRWAIG